MRNKLFLLFLLATLTTSAKVTLNPMFTDNMVLQQQTTAPIWGNAKAGAKVTLVASWDGKEYTTKADANGKWRIDVATPKAGGPYTINVSDGKKLILRNVMIGEVWLCSGQSNMEMPVVGPANNAWGKINDYKAEAAEAQNHPNIRMIMVKRNSKFDPQATCETDGGWKVCSTEAIQQFSATAYFFGRNIEKYRDVPVGLIETCWGGTMAEAWTSLDALRAIPYYRQAIDNYDETVKKMTEHNMKELSSWLERMNKLDVGAQGEPPLWTTLTFDDSGWKSADVPCDITDGTVPAFNGIIWMRKVIDIPERWQGKDLKINLGTVDDDDFTYFNGTLIGYTHGYDLQRYYSIPAESVKAGKAVITVRCIDNGGYGGFRGVASEMKMSLKENQTDSMSLAGEWKYKTTIAADQLEKVGGNLQNPPSTLGKLFNGMINPLIPYAIKGAIWYQGESNANHTATYYHDLMTTMINDWRTRWGYKFPFYFVQIANYEPQQAQPTESKWAEIREAQLQTLALENTGMAVAIDIGDAIDIHPKNKQEVGRRLALAARKLTYGEDVVYSGPIYKSYRIEGNSIRIFFDHTEGGLIAKNGEMPKGFAVAGADHKYHWAEAKIDGNTVVVSSKDVALPVAVRYAWATNPMCNLYNAAGLPASPFRTDCWRTDGAE